MTNQEKGNRIAELESELAEREAYFNLRRDADMRAIEMWQKATGREDTWPDHADMVVWLLERFAELESKVASMEDDLRWFAGHDGLFISAMSETDFNRYYLEREARCKRINAG